MAVIRIAGRMRRLEDHMEVTKKLQYEMEVRTKRYAMMLDRMNKKNEDEKAKGTTRDVRRDGIL